MRCDLNTLHPYYWQLHCFNLDQGHPMFYCSPPSSPGFSPLVPSWWIIRGLVWQTGLQSDHIASYSLVGSLRDKFPFNSRVILFQFRRVISCMIQMTDIRSRNSRMTWSRSLRGISTYQVRLRLSTIDDEMTMSSSGRAANKWVRGGVRLPNARCSWTPFPSVSWFILMICPCRTSWRRTFPLWDLRRSATWTRSSSSYRDSPECLSERIVEQIRRCVRAACARIGVRVV